MVIFRDVSDGTYAWEATFGGEDGGSGSLITDGVVVNVRAFPENWDHQGDGGDVRFHVEDIATTTSIPDVTISLYFLNGTWIADCTTNFLGSGYLHDVGDGIYGYDVYFQDELVDAGLVTIDSNLFTYETDDIAPVVSILSPMNGESINFEEDIQLDYMVNEINKYNIVVYLNGSSIGFKENGSIIQEASPMGSYILLIEVIDSAGNIGYDEVQFSVQATETTSSTSKTVPTTSIGSTRPANGFTILLGLIPILVILLKRKQGKKTN